MVPKKAFSDLPPHLFPPTRQIVILTRALPAPQLPQPEQEADSEAGDTFPSPAQRRRPTGGSDCRRQSGREDEKAAEGRDRSYVPLPKRGSGMN